MTTPFSSFDDDDIPLPDPARQPENPRVGARTAISAAWVIGSRLMAKCIDLALLVVLARLLTPADFGVVAIAMTLVQIVEAAFELPVIQVLVRMSEVDRRHYDTAFTMGLARGLVLAVALGLMAIPFASFYGDQRIIPIIVALSFAPASRGMLSPRMADYARAIDFRRDVAIEVGGKLVAFAIATGVAFATHSYWALVIGTVTTPFTMLVISFVLAPYRPRLSLFDWRTFADFLSWTTASQIIVAFNWQFDRLLLGRFVNSTRLGLYSMANDLSYLPEQSIIVPIKRPLLSAFAAIGNDRERVAEVYLRTSALLLAAGLPPIAGLSVLAEPAVRLALGAKWLPAVPILQWLAVTMIAPLFVSALGPLALALGQTRILLRQSVVELVVRVPLMTAGVLVAGLWGAVAMRIVVGVIMAAVSFWFVNQIVRMPMRRQLAAAGLPLFAGLVLTLTLVALRPLLDGVTGLALAIGLGLTGLAGLATYIATIFAVWRLTGRGLGIEDRIVDYLKTLPVLRGKS
ncbi:lipopolysaccharide biosynthesis protein [Novosphingobium sp. ZN18A2]|uniref:lipopolysaccharide biosynthesis protein n=1 Tax=Novosphingobium sp. ZN18A2 TaxID=3079861 RepID=UPI0030D44D00